jgi:Arc/MetJ family transcription regulator
MVPLVRRLTTVHMSGAGHRITCDLPHDLIAAAMTATGLPAKKASVEEALRRLVRRYRQKQAVADMAGLGKAISTRCGRAAARIWSDDRRGRFGLDREPAKQRG